MRGHDERRFSLPPLSPRWILLGEVVVALGAGVWLAGQPGWDWGRAVLVLSVLLLWVRLAYVALGFALAGVYPGARATPALGWRAGAGLYWREWWAFVRLYSFIQPLVGAGVIGLKRKAGLPGARVVILVHGYTCNEGAWWWWSPYLQRRGFRVETLTLEPMFGDIEGYVGLLGERVAVHRTRGDVRVCLVGHSMGGLVIRAYLSRYGWDGIDRAVSLGTPHQGSRLARFAPGVNASQMVCDSSWLAHLAGETPPPSGRALAVWSLHDNFVYPQGEQAWPGARAETVEGLGHLEMLVSRLLMERVARWLADGR